MSGSKEINRKLRTECSTSQGKDDLFQKLIETDNDVWFVMSLPDGHYEYMSPNAIDVFGYSPDDFYNSPLLINSIAHPEWREFVAEKWPFLPDGDTPSAYEYQIIHKKGETRKVCQRNQIQYDENGHAVSLIGKSNGCYLPE